MVSGLTPKCAAISSTESHRSCIKHNCQKFWNVLNKPRMSVWQEGYRCLSRKTSTNPPDTARANETQQLQAGHSIAAPHRPNRCRMILVFQSEYVFDVSHEIRFLLSIFLPLSPFNQFSLSVSICQISARLFYQKPLNLMPYSKKVLSILHFEIRERQFTSSNSADVLSSDPTSGFPPNCNTCVSNCPTLRVNLISLAMNPSCSFTKCSRSC